MPEFLSLSQQQILYQGADHSLAYCIFSFKKIQKICTIWTIKKSSAEDLFMSWLLPGTEMHTFISDNMISQILLPPSAVLHEYYHFHLQSLKEKKVFQKITWVSPRPLIIMGIKTNREIKGAPFNCLWIFWKFQKIIYQHQANYGPCHNSCHIRSRGTLFLAVESILWCMKQAEHADSHTIFLMLSHRDLSGNFLGVFNYCIYWWW